MPRITDFFICIYVLGWRLSVVRLCDSDFGITHVDDITIGITCAAHISLASSWYLFCLSFIVLTRLCVFETAMSIKKAFFVLLFIKLRSIKRYCFVRCDFSTAWNFHFPIHWLVCAYNMSSIVNQLNWLTIKGHIINIIIIVVIIFFFSVPLQAWTDPEGSRKLRFPDFVTTAQNGGKVVSLTHRPPLPPGNTPGTHFC